MDAYDILSVARSLKLNSRARTLAALGDYSVGIARFSKHPLWERHPASDEFLQVFEGELSLRLLGGDADATMLRPGSVFVVPRGVWHSPQPRGPVTLLYISDPRGSEVSNKQDPRTSR